MDAPRIGKLLLQENGFFCKIKNDLQIQSLYLDIKHTLPVVLMNIYVEQLLISSI
jgi:hypothetical protein